MSFSPKNFSRSPLVFSLLGLILLIAAPLLFAAKGQQVKAKLLAMFAPVSVQASVQRDRYAAADLPEAREDDQTQIYTSPTVPVLDPNITPYPRTSLHNFSDLLDAPAGKHGFVTSKNGHFYFANGKRARFWGINVANTSLQEPDADIAAMVSNFRSAGFNLVRLHHFDERDGIIDLDASDSRHFVPERLKKLDYWIYKAKQAGIYVYLDLLDYRRFKEGDGVANPDGIGRAARPYAVFDRRLIDLQKEYAYKLLREHVNPYTGLSYADDPSVVMLEIYDESGLFMKRNVWREMPEPYAANFKKLWNDWLKKRYDTTGKLLAAWADNTGQSALTGDEKLENGTVELPAMTWTPKQLPESQQIWAYPARMNDGALFAYHLHKLYFKEMRTYLRSIGVKVPISVTGRFDDLADLKSITEELDFVGTNFYYDHPYWGTGTPAWKAPSYFRNGNPLSDIDSQSFAAQMSLARIKGKPLVVREWNYCWPNRNRAAGIIEAASYAALHDIDAMILFVYETRPTARVSYFNVRSDPSRWGLCGIGASIFLKYLVKPSQHRIIVPYNEVDTFSYRRYHQALYALGWATRIENDFYDKTYKANGDKTDLLVMPGRSAVGTFSGAPAVLQTSSLNRDLAGRTLLSPEYLSEYKMKARAISNPISLTYNGLLYPNGKVLTRTIGFGLHLRPIIANGWRAIGFNHKYGLANGFVDEKNQRLVFGALEEDDVLRAALEAMKLFHGSPNSADSLNQKAFTSDTRELRRDAGNGRLIISAKEFQALCGNLSGVGRVLTPGLRVSNLKSGVLIALALDDKPLVDSRHFVVKMVSNARNVDEKPYRDPRFARRPDGQWMINQMGEGPVTTDGKPTTTAVQIAIEHKPLLDVFSQGGSWELYVDGDRREFYSDTPGVRFTLYDGQGAAGPAQLAARKATAPSSVDSKSLVAVGVDGKQSPVEANTSKYSVEATYPAQAAFVRWNR